MCHSPLKSFRTLEGAERRAAMRAHLTKAAALDFAAADPHALTPSQQAALADMAKAVSWRKSPTSPLAVGPAFFVYLSRDVLQVFPKIEKSPVLQVRAKNQNFAFGRGAA